MLSCIQFCCTQCFKAEIYSVFSPRMEFLIEICHSLNLTTAMVLKDCILQLNACFSLFDYDHFPKDTRTWGKPTFPRWQQAPLKLYWIHQRWTCASKSSSTVRTVCFGGPFLHNKRVACGSDRRKENRNESGRALLTKRTLPLLPHKNWYIASRNSPEKAQYCFHCHAAMLCTLSWMPICLPF